MPKKLWNNLSWRTKLLVSLAFLIYFIPRVVSLGWDISSYDVRYWRPRMRNFVEAIERGNLRETYQQYHPGVTLMWLSGFAERSFERVAELKSGYNQRYRPKWYPLRHFVSKFPLVFVISVLGAVCFYYIKKFTNTKYALIFSFLLSLEPFFLGTSRFLHLSALTSMFMFTSFLLMYVYVREKRPFHFILSAVLLGLAVLTKMDGVLAGIASISLLGLYSFRSFSDLKNLRIWKNFILKSLGYGALSFLTFFIFFPAMWFGPVQVIRKMIGDGIYETAFASTGAMMLIPFRHLYYFEAFFLRSLPTTVVLVALFPLFFFTKREKKLKSFMLPNLLFLLVIWLILSIPGKTKDRYLVNFSPGLAALAAFSFYGLLSGLKKTSRLVLLGLIALLYFVTIYRYHPVYSFYYNDLIGGQAGIERLGLKVINRGEYWAQAAHFINRQEPEPDIYNRNTIVPDREQLPSFKDYFKGKTYADSKFMPEGYHAHYVATRKDFLERVPETCKEIARFGPRDPMGYDFIYVFSCGKTVDNTYKFKN